MASHHHPDDMFDHVPEELQRLGAHRAVVRRRSGWWTVLWSAVATVVIVAGGAFAYSLMTGVFGSAETDAATATASATATAEPITDPDDIDADRDITITVLNGTTTTDLDQIAAKKLTKAGWPVGTAADAEDRTAETTTVYYTDAADEDVARGVAIALGVGGVALTDADLGAPITVVLGSDYAEAQD
ncbi:MAG: LytR C-terminal domain-containing protein [Microbacteriaceae bacterium]